MAESPTVAALKSQMPSALSQIRTHSPSHKVLDCSFSQRKRRLMREVSQPSVCHRLHASLSLLLALAYFLLDERLSD